jgi:hypothetical protein
LCRCGAAFTRRDLLTRHWRITHHAGNPEVTESASSSETITIDSHQPQEVSHVLDIAANETGVTIATATNEHLLPTVQQHHVAIHDPTAPFQGVQTHLIAPGKPS